MTRYSPSVKPGRYDRISRALLDALSRAPSLSSELAGALQLDWLAVSQRLTSLRANRIVRGEYADATCRAKRWRLTERGEALLDRLRRIPDAAREAQQAHAAARELYAWMGLHHEALPVTGGRIERRLGL